MPKYIIRHSIQQYPESQDHWINIWKEIRERACGETRWLHSFLIPEKDQLYCQWDAESLEDIVSCLGDDVLPMAPIDYSAEIVTFDPAWLDEVS